MAGLYWLVFIVSRKWLVSLVLVDGRPGLCSLVQVLDGCMPSENIEGVLSIILARLLVI